MTTAGETTFVIRRYEVLHYASGFRDTTTVRTVAKGKGLSSAVRTLDTLAKGVAERIGATLNNPMLNHTASHRLDLAVNQPYSSLRHRTIHYYLTTTHGS